MYDFDTWGLCLSFIQVSVAFNFASILAPNRIGMLFRTSEIKSIDISECVTKLGECQAKLEGNFSEETFKDYNKVIASYLKLNNLYTEIAIYQKLKPVCFEYACLLLGLYGILGLLIIPISNPSSCTTKFYIVFTGFVLLGLLSLLIIEVLLRFKKQVFPDDRSFVAEIFIVLICMLLSYIITQCNIPQDIWLCCEKYICDVSIFVPYLSFTVCFFIYLYDEYKKKSTNQGLEKNKLDFYMKACSFLNP